MQETAEDCEVIVAVGVIYGGRGEVRRGLPRRNRGGSWSGAAV